jgi:aminoglycoside phosphotransferase family enzyme/predicted kinase
MSASARASQGEVFTFLADPATHGLREPVKRIDTHGAVVFLAGKDVYKVKRAVSYPFMDFSTLEKRRFFCEREVAVNKANAPDLYLGAVPVSRDGSRLKFGGGDVIEWTVHLRRFDENRTLDRLADRSELDSEIIASLAATAAQSHKRAETVTSAQALRSLKGHIEETLAELEAAPEIFAGEKVKALRGAIGQALAQNETLLTEREKQGQVCRCHGDLHLRNIAMVGGAPVLFDAIEFDESIATCDVLYDLAFLLMDLWTRGLTREANLLFNRYLWLCDEVGIQIKGISALPLFLSLRAAIRAKVAILQPGQASSQHTSARLLFEAALAFLAPAGRDLIAIGGLSGTGKSSLAAALAASIGRAPGAVILRSDVERKRLFGGGEFDRLPGEAYSPQTTERVYERLRGLAAAALSAGQSAILDAVYLRPEERDAAERIAAQNHARFTGLWLEAPLGTLEERVTKRTKDASDATAGIVAAQAKQLPGTLDWRRLDASGSLEATAASALPAIMR